MNTTLLHASVTQLQQALQHLTRHLPPAIHQEHAVLARHSPRAWADMAEKYAGDVQIEAAADIVSCIATIQGVVARVEAANRAPNLKLGKVRPGVYGAGK